MDYTEQEECRYYAAIPAPWNCPSCGRLFYDSKAHVCPNELLRIKAIIHYYEAFLIKQDDTKFQDRTGPIYHRRIPEGIQSVEIPTEFIRNDMVKLFNIEDEEFDKIIEMIYLKIIEDMK